MTRSRTELLPAPSSPMSSRLNSRFSADRRRVNRADRPPHERALRGVGPHPNSCGTWPWRARSRANTLRLRLGRPFRHQQPRQYEDLRSTSQSFSRPDTMPGDGGMPTSAQAGSKIVVQLNILPAPCDGSLTPCLHPRLLPAASLLSPTYSSAVADPAPSPQALVTQLGQFLFSQP